MGGISTGRNVGLLVAVMVVAGLPGVADAREIPAPVATAGVGTPAETFRPLVGDFTGDGLQDLIIYGVGLLPDQLADVERPVDIFCSSVLQAPSRDIAIDIAVSSTATPVVGDFTGDNVDDIFWYAPGPAVDRLWDFNASWTLNYTARSFSVAGSSYRPVAGDLSGDGVDDLIWYAPGTSRDSIWDFNPGGAHTLRALNVNGTYQPLIGRFSPDSKEDVFWYAPGSGRESLWTYTDATFRPGIHNSSLLQVNGTYLTAVTDTWGMGQDDIVFVLPGTAPDRLWDFYGNSAVRKEFLLDSQNPWGFGIADSMFKWVVSLNFDGQYGGLLFLDQPDFTNWLFISEVFDSDVVGGTRSFLSCPPFEF